MKLLRVKSHTIQFTKLAIITLTTLFAFLSNIPSRIDGTTLKIESCTKHCNSEFSKAQKDKNCNDCCVKASKKDTAKGYCGLFKKCACNIPSQLSSRFTKPRFLQGPLCLQEINAVRRTKGVKPLAFNSKLQKVSYKHTGKMIRHNSFCDVCPGEAILLTRVLLGGYSYINANQLIHAATEDERLDCKMFVKLWLKDDKTRFILFNNDYTEFGCDALACNNCEWYWYITCTIANSIYTVNNNRSVRKGLISTFNKSKSSKRSSPTFRRF